VTCSGTAPVTMTGRPSSASRAAWWLNGTLASRGISPQMLSCSGAEGNSGVVVLRTVRHTDFWGSGKLKIS